MGNVLLFDLDGTLVDTERCAMEVVDAFYKKVGITVPSDQLEYLVGRPWLVGLEYLQQRYPQEKSVAQIEMECLEQYRKALHTNVPVIPGALEAIKSFATSYRLGIVSGSRRQDIESILELIKLSDFFEHIVGFEDYSEGKPSPAPYLKALEIFGVKKALAFEDSFAGMTAAHAAGIPFIGIGNIHFPAALKRIPNFEGINSEWLKQVAY